MVTTMFVLDRTLNTSHILTANKNSQSAFWEDTYTQEFDTGAESLEFSCYTHEGVKEGNFVAFFYNSQYKMFQITEIEEVHKNGRLVAECYCETASLQLLNNYVRPFSGDMNCIQFFEYILNGTEWRIGKYSNSLKDKVITVNETGVESVWSLIEDYKDLFECEINTYVTYENGHVTGQFIDIFSEGGLGSATYKRFEYGKNVTGITKFKDLYDWCTGIIIDCNCDVTDTIIRESQGYGFTKGAGDVILDDNANRMYNAGRTHVIGVYEGDETEPVEACINAWKELEKRKAPKFDYKVTTALTDDEYEEIHLGDTVYVVDHSYTPALLLEARVGKLELSFTNRSENTCTLTNYKEIKSKLLDANYIKLTGTITDIVSSFFPITNEGIADGAISDGKIDTVYYQQITADIVSAGIGAFENLYAQGLTVINADIEKLNADTADITQLKAQVADIDTLVNGHLTSDNIQSIIITGDKFTVADGFIKNAMIDNITADKITTGSINTDNVYISSEDGSMIINGSLQQFKDKDGNVRIQIGKDAQDNFTFSLFDEDGTGVLINEKGITENAIADGLIVNDHVAENANIAGSKLDIDSVVTEINEGTTTIKGAKVVLDDTNQTLDVAFNILNTKVDDIEEEVTSNTTAINVQQGQIDTLISNTTITKENGEVVQLKDEYNSTKDTVDSHATKIGSLETTVNTVSSKQSSMELDLNGFRTEVSNTYISKDGYVGVNFIKNGRMTGAKAYTHDVPEWTWWGSFEVHGNPQAYGDKLVCLRPQVVTTDIVAGIFQPIWKDDIPRNTQVTLSYHIGWEPQCNGAYVDITYYKDDGTQVGTTYEINKGQSGNLTHTFTTQDIDYDYFRVGIVMYGLKADIGGHFLVIFGNVKLELGSTATAWCENYANYTTKTEFNQTNEDFTFRISQSGGGNLLKNSLFKDGTRHWSFYSWDYTYLTHQTCYIWEPNTGDWSHGSRRSFTAYNAYTHSGAPANSIISSEWCDVVPGDTYSYSFYCRQHRCWAYVEIKGLQYDGNTRTISAFEIEPYENGDKDDRTFNSWKYTGNAFTIPSDIKAITLWIVITQHEPGATSLDSYFWLAEPCITRSAVPMHWVPHESELYDGIVKIDNTGLTVQQGNNKSLLDSEALKFYSGTELYSKVDGGLFKVMKPGDDSVTVGSVGRYQWVNNGACCTAIASGPGHAVTMGSVRESGASATCSLTDCSQGGFLTGSTWYYDQGLNINKAYCGTLHFKGSKDQAFSSQAETDLGALTLWGTLPSGNNSEGYPSHTGYIYSRDTLQFGIAYGPLKVAMEICEASWTSNNTSIHMYGPLNMHGYNISNAGWVNPVSASSEYTSRLLREGSIEHMNYGTLSYYDGELRWCWREPVFTYAECDIDPATDEWVYTGRNICYVELPIFMAESIEADYHISVGKIGWGDYRILEKNQYYFILESQEEDFAFTFEVVAKLVDGQTLNNNVSIASMSTTANPAISVDPPTSEDIILPGSEDIWESAVVEEVEENLQDNINKGEE